MASFDKAIEVVLRHEGGYVNHPSDPGGETKFGITKRSYPDINIKSLTLDEAKKIYKRDFWDKGRYSEINHDDLGTKIFDTAVNTGPSRAFRLVQESCNNLGSKLKVDGDMGPRTVSAINSMDGEKILVEFRKLQGNFYLSLILKNPDLAAFQRGWLNRANA